MMRTQPLARSRRLGLFVLMALLGLTVGCNKMIANHYIKKADTRVAKAKDNEADRFTKDQFEQTTQAVSTARNQLNAQQYKEAKASAKLAAEQSQTLLDATIERRATYLKSEAFNQIQIADQNKAIQIDEAKYQKILDDNNKGTELMDEQKYEKAIPILQGVVDQVKFLLDPLSKRAKDGLERAKVMREELIAEGALEHASDYVTLMNDQIEEIRVFIEEEYHYRNALSMYERAQQTKIEGVQETKKVKCEKMLAEIENLLGTATDLGAAIYASQSFTQVSDEFSNLLTKFYDSRYDTVLSSAPNLKPKVEDLIVETKREVARARRNDVEKALTDLVEGHVRDYLPGRAEQLEALLTEADGLFAEEKYTESKDVSLRALELEQRIIEEFDTFTANRIRESSDKLAMAEGVFERMEQIFAKEIPGEWTGDDFALEQNKQALQEELSAQLNNARLSLGVAELKRGEQEFHTAIQTSDQVFNSSEYVVGQTYRVVAHNAILELANELTRLERDGGRAYAAAEVDKTHAMLDECKQLLREDEYRQAVRRTADTKAQVEIVSQELHRVAVANIEQAQADLEQARENFAEQYQGEDVALAMVELERARASLGDSGHQISIEAAARASQIAREAENSALDQWARDQLVTADDYIARASAAGAREFAPEKLQRAHDIRNNLQELINGKELKIALAVGTEAVDASQQAFYAEVIEAENAIDTAKRFEGWKYEHARLADAIVHARIAREKLEGAQYLEARQHAVQAITMANNVTRDAKRTAFAERIESLKAHMDTAQRDGVGYYQVNDLSKILGEMNALQNSFDPSSFDDYAQKVDLLEAQLAGLMELTPSVLRDLVANMQEQLEQLEARGAKIENPELIDEIERSIKYAQLDFKDEKYRPSFMNAKEAQQGLNELRVELNERDFDQALGRELSRFNDELEAFGPVLELGSVAMVHMVIGAEGRSQARAFLSAQSPSDLRSAITEIGVQVRSLEAPESRVEMHRAALEMLAVAKTASANFEKVLIMDRYDPMESRKIVQTAFLQMHRARTMQNDIQRAIKNPVVKFEPIGVEQVISYQNF